MTEVTGCHAWTIASLHYISHNDTTPELAINGLHVGSRNVYMISLSYKYYNDVVG